MQSTVEDYVLAFYDVAPERLERSLHPDLQKVGYFRGSDGAYRYATMTYEQALDLAAHWNRDGSIPDDAPRDITVYEVNDQTAIAKLVAHWGVDYFHLGRYDGEWKIINVIWQSPPPSGP